VKKQGDFINHIPEWGGLLVRTDYEEIVCKFCNSPEIVRNGTRKGTQYWLCKNCGRGFVANKALPKMKYPTEAIGSALYMYFTGSSLNDIRRHVEQQYKALPSDSAIYGWVTRFSKLASDEAKKHKPENIGDVWIADELYLSLSGKRYYLWDIIDSKTRYLIATYLSPKRGSQQAKKLMELASERAGKVPKVVITDSLGSYLDGIELAYGSETKHIQSQPFAKHDSTNLIERWHATLRERTKVMWGMKKPDTTRLILDGFLVFYNYFRPHESLNEKTPSEVAGIQFPYKNWLDVVNSQSPLGQFKETNKLPLDEEVAILYPTQPYRKRTKPKKKLHRTRDSIPTMLKGMR